MAVSDGYEKVVMKLLSTVRFVPVGVPERFSWLPVFQQNYAVRYVRERTFVHPLNFGTFSKDVGFSRRSWGCV